MRILLLTHYFAPDVTTNCDIMTGLADQWVAWGHQVTVVTSVPHYAAGQVPPEFTGRLVYREERGNLRVFRTYVYVARQRGNLAQRVWSYVTFNALSTLVALFAGGYDVILAPSPPLTIGLSAFLISRLRRVPYIYNVHDIYPDIALKLGLLKNRWLTGLLRGVERFVYRTAAAVTVLSTGIRDNLLGKGVPPGKVRVIPNFADTQRVQPLARRNGWAESLGLNGQFVVMYAGNLGNSQPVAVLLEAARHLRDDPAVRVVIIGNPARIEALRATAAAEGLSNVLLLPFQPKERVPEMYAAADVNVVLLRREVGVESVPSKTYTIMASGRPVLASVAALNEIAGLVQRADCGLWVPPEDATALAEAARQLQADPARRAQLGRNGRQAVEAHYTQPGVAQAYLDLFEQVMKRV